MLDHYLHTAYAAEQLICQDREPLVLARPQTAAAPEEFANADQAMAWFMTEHAVLLAVTRHAALMGFDSHGWQLPWVLSTFLDRLGYWADYAATNQSALEASRRLADQSAQAWAHRTLATAYVGLQRYDDADVHFRQAVDLYRELGDPFGEAKAQNAWSSMPGRQGRYADALSQGRRALELYVAIGHRLGHSSALGNIGWTQALLGDYPSALATCQEALALHAEGGHQAGQATTLHSLGYIHHHLGHHRRALDHYQRALGLFRHMGDRHSVADTLTCVGDTMMRQAKHNWPTRHGRTHSPSSKISIIWTPKGFAPRFGGHLLSSRGSGNQYTNPG